MEQQFRGVTHHRPDEDELTNVRIIEIWGTQQFPGVADSPLLTEDAGLQLSEDEARKWFENGYLLIGTGGPFVLFDEHGKGDGASAATIAAAYYGLTADAGLQRILAYSLRADDKAQDHPFAMATVIKNFHSAGVPLERVRAKHRGWFDALYLVDTGAINFDAHHATFKQMAIAWLIARYGEPEHRSLIFGSFADAMEAIGLSSEKVDEVREIARFVDADASKGAFSSFDVRGLSLALQMAGATEEYVINDVHDALDAKVYVQREFLSALKCFKKEGSYLDGVHARIAVICSDNEQMHRAARFADRTLAVLVQQRSDGHVQIFSDQKRDLRPIIRRLRDVEYRKSGRKGTLPMAVLSGGGTHPLVPAWYGFEKYGKVIHVFNGSLKTRRTPKTRLSLDEVVSCVREGMAHVHRPRGVQRDKK